MYIKVREGKVAKTIPLGEDKFLDVAEKGEVIGWRFYFLKIRQKK